VPKCWITFSGCHAPRHHLDPPQELLFLENFLVKTTCFPFTVCRLLVGLTIKAFLIWARGFLHSINLLCLYYIYYLYLPNTINIKSSHYYSIIPDFESKELDEGELVSKVCEKKQEPKDKTKRKRRRKRETFFLYKKVSRCKIIVTYRPFIKAWKRCNRAFKDAFGSSTLFIKVP